MVTQVLLIDPDINFMVSIKTALEGAGGFRVSVAANGWAADELLRHGAPDVVVVDFDVPDMDVMELFQRIRQIRPDLPVILTPFSIQQHDRARLMDADEILSKPYNGRDLIPVVYDVLEPDLPDAQMAAEDVQETQSLRDTEPLATDGMPGMVEAFDDSDESADFSDSYDGPAVIPERDRVSDLHLSRHDEPPIMEGDTPSMPDYDPEAIHTFLAADRDGVPHGDFGEALDAVGRIEAQPPADKRDEFRELVDSMRPSGVEKSHVSRLEELIQSLGTGQIEGEPPESSGAAVDLVLDAIRRGQPPPETDELTFELDDTTIGEVISRLFEPSPERMAAMAGESIDEKTPQEPMFETEEHEQRTFQKGAGPPPTLPEELMEPPPGEEDSRHYPATAALTALSASTGDEDDDDSGRTSLDVLLNQIEAQLPPARTHRPHLKPLPSWGQIDLVRGSEKVEAIFDRMEGVRRGPEISAVDEEPDISRDDTRPSRALLDAMDAVQDDATRPVPPLVPDEPDAESDFAYETKTFPEPDAGISAVVEDEEPASDEFDTAFDIEFDTEMLSIADLLAIADLPVEASTEEIQREIRERASASSASSHADQLENQETVTDGQVDDEGEEYEVSQPGSDPFGSEDDFDAESGEVYATLASNTTAQSGIFPPDEDELVPLPADTAAMIIETGAASAEEIDQIEDEKDDAVIAAIAVQLTQFSLESSSQATMISRLGQRLAEAGKLPDAAMDQLFDLVDQAWQNSPNSESLIRYITLEESGEFLLYSTRVEHDLFLSMVFHSAMPVRTIRKQARRLSESLELVPEDSEPPAAKTLPSRPTDMRPPEGWAEAVKGTQELTVDESVPVRPAREEEETYIAYTCVWLPADPTLELLDDLADGLAEWIEDIAADHAWNLDDLAIFPDYVLVSLRAPQKALPDQVITTLMDETAHLSAEVFPRAANGGPFWTDGYYMVSPPRELSEREIARFITYQRQAQLG